MHKIIISALAGLLLAPGAMAQTVSSVSVIGDSLVFRSGWECAGVEPDPAECTNLKVDSSFASHLAYPYPYTPTPVFDLVDTQGIGGSTCFRRAGDEGLLRRLRGFPSGGVPAYEYEGEARIMVLMGINDVNGHGKSAAQTATCLKTGWSYIANSLGAKPVVLLYPPMNGSAWGGLTPAQANSNRLSLNFAIRNAVNEFNATQLANGKPQAEIITSMENLYNPSTATFDGVHPNPTGATTIAQFIFWFYH